MDKLEALEKAKSIWESDGGWGHGPEDVLFLARTRLFNYREISVITGKTNHAVRGVTWDADMPRYVLGDRFDPRSLDSLILLLVHYTNTGLVADGVVDLISPHTSKRVISRMTGIPIAEL